MPYRVIIAGGREFQDYELVRQKCDYYLQNKLKSDTVIIVSGHATGADTLGERYARNEGWSVNCTLPTGTSTARQQAPSGMHRWPT